VLEIRPTLVPGTKSDQSAIVDLKSTVTVPSEGESEGGIRAGVDSLAPAVDRIAIESQEFATTLRVPLGKPVLVGGLTYVPSSQGNVVDAGGAAPGAASEQAQLYLVLEVR
jgi:hypothetical protein